MRNFKRIHFNFPLLYMCVCMKHSGLMYWRYCVIAGIEIIIGAKQFVTLDPLLIKCRGVETMAYVPICMKLLLVYLYSTVIITDNASCNTLWFCLQKMLLFWNSHPNLVRKRVIWCNIEYLVLLMLKNIKN